MARPKMQEGQPNARAQMLEAFWDLIEEKPCNKITVADVVKHVGVNRNTFYYHFQDVPDYIDQAVVEHINGFSKVIVGVIGSHFGLQELVQASGAEIGSIPEKPTFAVKRANLLVGPHSSARVIDIVKRQIYGRFITSFGIDEEKLDRFDAMSIRFVLAGVIEMWSCIDEFFDPEEVTFGQLFASPIAQSTLGMLSGILERQGLDINLQ